MPSTPPPTAAATGIQVRALKLRDGRFDDFWTQVDPAWEYHDFIERQGNPYFHEAISFDCLLADDRRDTVWCGIATFSGDIFYAWDRRRERFRSLNYPSVGDRYDAKFHRALTFDRRGQIWAATALLHDPIQYFDAPGGAIVRFDPDREKITIVDRPFPHLYIQSLVLDPGRNILYGQTYTPEYLFRYDIDTGRARILAHLGQLCGVGTISQCEQLTVDGGGTVWGCYVVNRAWGQSPGPRAHRLLKYHPDQDKVQFLDRGLPSILGGSRFLALDSTALGPEGAVYMSAVGEGALYRLDPRTERLDFIGQPGQQKGQRLSAMSAFGDKLYGVCGKGGIAELFSYHPGSGNLVNYGAIYDAQQRVGAYQIHDIAITADGTIYAGENDVPHRSSYLWEIQGAIPS